jgi:hypothetical protein
MRLPFAGLVLAVMLLGGCNSYDLRYAAVPQPKNAHLYADCTILQDGVTVFVDTDGKRMEDIYVKKADGTVVHPASVQHAGYYQSAALGPGVGAFGNHVGGGVGLGIPIGPKTAHGLSGAFFPFQDRGPDKPGVGNPPWNVYVKVHGVEEAMIPGVGGAATVK